MKQSKIILNNITRSFFQSAVLPFLFLLSASHFASAQMIIDLVEVKVTLDTGSVTLTWVLSSPNSENLYHVQRSGSSGDFVTIGTADDSYSFTDNNPLEGENKYRLSQEIDDTQTAYSEPTSVTFYHSRALSLNPNPASNNLQVHYKLEKDVFAYIQLLDQMGTLLEQHTLDTHSNENGYITLQVSGYSSGLYFIRLVDNEVVEVKQFYKQ